MSTTARTGRRREMQFALGGGDSPGRANHTGDLRPVDRRRGARPCGCGGRLRPGQGRPAAHRRMLDPDPRRQPDAEPAGPGPLAPWDRLPDQGRIRARPRGSRRSDPPRSGLGVAALRPRQHSSRKAGLRACDRGLQRRDSPRPDRLLVPQQPRPLASCGGRLSKRHRGLQPGDPYRSDDRVGAQQSRQCPSRLGRSRSRHRGL